ncbi:MAG: chemotaxis protein CheB [Candidatus Manganitrophus sp.]|nr:chemotaxis protein CheB [Candidatus Manganitrophus sp.]WDT71235.1 MAG: chemotaxis protein CheB [Candidatus Manganitrophus sp.]WDT81461.1 MAG: chemotaxis protein CheB [Candidatus Manganitrophus sp.]
MLISKGTNFDSPRPGRRGGSARPDQNEKRENEKENLPEGTDPARIGAQGGAAGAPFSGNELPVVGIGASAGGLEPIETFFDRISADSGVAFVVVQHMDPHHKSIMAELLGRHTEMPVRMAENRMQVAPNTVYVNPPGKYLTLFHGMLHLSDPDPNQGVRFPIDSFLRSLAEDRGHRSVSILLSGGGTDGTLGLKAVKAAGGMTMVQEEGSAKFGGMLRSAVASGSVDYVLPVEEMPKEVIRYIRHPYTAKSAPLRKRSSRPLSIGWRRSS